MSEIEVRFVGDADGGMSASRVTRFPSHIHVPRRSRSGRLGIADISTEWDAPPRVGVDSASPRGTGTEPRGTVTGPALAAA